MTLITYPLNDITYEAADAELFHCTRTSGIWTNQDFPLTNLGNNKIQVGKGIAWIKNQEFAGKVAALKVPETLNMGIANGTYPRIDVIALRFSVNSNETTVVLKQGTPASNPARPAITRTGDIYELYLASVYRPAGATSITAANITDLRLDSSVCGLMADSVTSIDTTLINAQINGFVSDWNTKSNASISSFETKADKLVEDTQAAVDDIVGGTDVMLKSEWTSNGIIPSSKIDTGTIPISKGGTGATTAAAALAALGGTSIDLLWTNASSSSVFASQEITLDLQKYEFLLIEHSGSGLTWCELLAIGIVCTLTETTHIGVSPDTEAPYIFGRRTTSTLTSITFRDCYLRITGNSGYISKENNYCKPLKIYGIKK